VFVRPATGCLSLVGGFAVLTPCQWPEGGGHKSASTFIYRVIFRVIVGIFGVIFRVIVGIFGVIFRVIVGIFGVIFRVIVGIFGVNFRVIVGIFGVIFRGILPVCGRVFLSFEPPRSAGEHYKKYTHSRPLHDCLLTLASSVHALKVEL
jgi:hypothetical protein